MTADIIKGVVSAGVQIGVIWMVYYYIFVFFRGTRGAQVLVGLAVLFFGLVFLTQTLSLDVLAWILQRFSVVLGVALLVIFQPEIRRALAELGRQPVFSMSADRRSVIEGVVQAVEYLADHKIGGLIAVEREIGTRNVQETGIQLDAKLAPELLASLFFPHTPLHDGGVVISGDRIVAAACVFPLSQDMDLLKTLGTRHRAAVGLTEETDAVVVVVSEETGTISVSYRGRLSRGLDGERVRRFLSALLREKKPRKAWQRVQQKLDLTPGAIAKSDSRSGEELARGD